MTQYSVNKYDFESTSKDLNVRRHELHDQLWNRDKTNLLADKEQLKITNDHWKVILYLRKYYLKHGLEPNARHLSYKLGSLFKDQGGSKYLYSLFPGGPVTQGSRLGNLKEPPSCIDPSHGTCY